MYCTLLRTLVHRVKIRRERKLITICKSYEWYYDYVANSCIYASVSLVHLHVAALVIPIHNVFW